MSIDRRAARVLADLGRTRTRAGRDRLGRFRLEGTRLHERALRAGARVESAVVARGFAGLPDRRVSALLSDLGRSSCALHVVDDEILEELTEGRDLGAIVGLSPMPRVSSLEALLEGTPAGRRVVLVAVDVEEPGNVGAMVRTALAGGATAFVAAGISDPFHPKAVRTSMGAVFRIPVLARPDVSATLRELRRAGFQLVGSTSRCGAAPRGARFDTDRVALLLGSEPFGLPGSIHDAVDLVVSIPMAEAVDSFSVNAAAAILLYELSQTP